MQALLTPAIAFFAVYVSVAQGTTARNKLRFDLFEKRFAIYEGAKNFIGSIVTSGKVNDDEFYKYMRTTNTVKWVVGPEVEDYLKRELYDPAIELQSLQAELEGLPVGEERSRNVARQSAIKTSINAQFEELDRWFNPYLRLAH